ncbi:MAG: HAMP domain-containing protein [Anaerolineales bacterium]|nr:HAMP domain-containing protein [Anaerolineales bacterium]
MFQLKSGLHSLRIKLILAFFAVLITGIALMVASAYWATTREFDRFLLNQSRTALQERIITYYETEQTLEGFSVNDAGVPMESGIPGDFQPRGIEITNAEGEVVFPVNESSDQTQPRTINTERAIPVETGGSIIAYIEIPQNPMNREPNENAFLERARNMFLYGAGGSILVALILGIVIARQLIQPLQELNAATQAVANGDLELRVPVRSQDELGMLANSFNQMNARLAEARDQRRQLTADIAHELRTPLSIILGHAEAVVDGVLPPSPESAALILDESERLEKLIEDLRVLSLADTGELSYKMHPCAPGEIISRVCTAFGPLTNQKGVALKTSISPDLPAITVDPGRMNQVLSNLIANALRYTPAGGTITLSAVQKKESLELRVSDEGPGIPEEDLASIFNRFYRLDKSRQREEGGSGLGLAIARSIVNFHNGEIFAENNNGIGSCFVILLPLPDISDQTDSDRQ